MKKWLTSTKQANPERDVTIIAKGDSAASNHYWREEDKKVLDNIEDFAGPKVVLPNNSTIGVTKIAQLPFSTDLSDRAKNAMILPGLKSASLVSIGQLCDDGVNVVFNKTKLVAIKNNKIILQGTRNLSDGLWDIPIHKKHITSDNYPPPNIHPGIYSAKPPPVQKGTISSKNIPKTQEVLRPPNYLRKLDHLIQDNIDYIDIDKQLKQDNKTVKIQIRPDNPSMAVIINKKQTHAELARYLHTTCFSPVKSTFLKGIKKHHFKTWPGLTPNVLKHLPKSVNTAQGHLHQERQNLQSTNPKSEKPDLKKIKKHFESLKAKLKPGQTLEQVLTQEIDTDNFPSSPSPNTKSQDVAYMIINKSEVCTAYTDLTGRFPCRSSSGNEYLMIAYHYDGNVIVAKPLKIEKRIH